MRINSQNTKYTNIFNNFTFRVTPLQIVRVKSHNSLYDLIDFWRAWNVVRRRVEFYGRHNCTAVPVRFVCTGRTVSGFTRTYLA